MDKFPFVSISRIEELGLAYSDFVTCAFLNGEDLNVIHRSYVISNVIRRPICDTFLPVSLAWDDGPPVCVNDILTTDFSAGIKTFGASVKTEPVGQPKVIIIYGGSHSGKSTLMNYLQFQWVAPNVDHVQLLKKIPLVILVQTKLIKCEGPFQEFCLELFGNDVEKRTKEQILKTLKSVRVLWLVDGYGEASDAMKGYIRKIVREFPQSRVIITSVRPYRVELESMLDELKEEYVKLQIEDLKVNNTWKLMVPKMIAAKTLDNNLITEATAKFIECKKESLVKCSSVNAGFLGLVVDFWMEDNYPQRSSRPSQRSPRKTNPDGKEAAKAKPRIDWSKFPRNKDDKNAKYYTYKKRK